MNYFVSTKRYQKPQGMLSRNFTINVKVISNNVDFCRRKGFNTDGVVLRHWVVVYRNHLYGDRAWMTDIGSIRNCDRQYSISSFRCSSIRMLILELFKDFFASFEIEPSIPCGCVK